MHPLFPSVFLSVSSPHPPTMSSPCLPFFTHLTVLPFPLFLPPSEWSASIVPPPSPSLYTCFILFPCHVSFSLHLSSSCRSLKKSGAHDKGSLWCDNARASVLRTLTAFSSLLCLRWKTWENFLSNTSSQLGLHVLFENMLCLMYAEVKMYILMLQVVERQWMKDDEVIYSCSNAQDESLDINNYIFYLLFYC